MVRETEAQPSQEDVVRLGMAEAFVKAFGGVPLEEQRLTPELAARLNEFGRTVDSQLDIKVLELPIKAWDAGNARQRASALGSMVGKLHPRRVVAPWNAAIRRLDERSFRVSRNQTRTIGFYRYQILPVILTPTEELVIKVIARDP